MQSIFHSFQPIISINCFTYSNYHNIMHWLSTINVLQFKLLAFGYMHMDNYIIQTNALFVDQTTRDCDFVNDIPT